MAWTIKNSSKFNTIVIASIDLKKFQRLIVVNNQLSSVTCNYRTVSLNMSLDKFIDCLCGKSGECEIDYRFSELQCQHCNNGLTDWVHNAMKKPVSSYGDIYLDYSFNPKKVLVYHYNKNVKWILGHPVIKNKMEICNHCKGTGLYEVLNLKSDIKKIKVEKELLLKELGELK